MKPGKFYVYQYKSNWYFCVASYVSGENGDMNMKFVHPKRLSEKLFWPQCDDVYWIPIEGVYCEADAPSTGNTGRFYCFDKKTQKILKAISMKTSSFVVHYYVSSYFPVTLTLSV